jgi:hypothetical protein
MPFKNVTYFISFPPPNVSSSRKYNNLVSAILQTKGRLSRIFLLTPYRRWKFRTDNRNFPLHNREM